MAADDERLLELALELSDDARADWHGVEHQADEARVAFVRQLRAVDRIARFYRDQEPDAVPKPPPTTEPDLPLRSWGHLRLIERVGGGSFGEVFRAWDSRLQREVALKLLAAADGQEDVIGSVLREGRLLARVRHPNVVTVHGIDRIDGRVGLWMELVRGRTLAEWVREQGSLGAREAALIGIDLASALAAVHHGGLVHRDVKAQNVMREEGGRIVLMDFGAGKELARLAPGPDLSGTPLYMAPEVLLGAEATPQADVYSLGVLLYHLVSAGYPVQAQSLSDLRRAHEDGERRELRDVRPDLPEAFVQIIGTALASREKRFPSAGTLQAALASFLGQPGQVPRPAPPRRAGLLASLGLLAGVAILAIWAWTAWHAPGRSSLPSAVPPQVARSADEPVTAPEDSEGAPAYDVEAGLYLATSGGHRRLESGARVAPGDRLFLELRSSVDLFVYVLNEDEGGEAYLLFPLPNSGVLNPLPPGRAQRLPGPRGGRDLFWQVTSAGGVEHFVIVASPTRLPLLEAEIRSLPPPELGALAAPLPAAAAQRLRGIGGLAASPRRPTASSGRIAEVLEHLEARTERVRGPWVRRFDLRNPGP